MGSRIVQCIYVYIIYIKLYIYIYHDNVSKCVIYNVPRNYTVTKRLFEDLTFFQWKVNASQTTKRSFEFQVYHKNENSTSIICIYIYIHNEANSSRLTPRFQSIAMVVKKMN